MHRRPRPGKRLSIQRRARRLSKPSESVRFFGLSRDGVVRLICAHPRPCVGVAAPVAAHGALAWSSWPPLRPRKTDPLFTSSRSFLAPGVGSLMTGCEMVRQCPPRSGHWAALLAARFMSRISSLGRGCPDRFKLDQRAWSVPPVRHRTTVNCNPNCNLGGDPAQKIVPVLLPADERHRSPWLTLVK